MAISGSKHTDDVAVALLDAQTFIGARKNIFFFVAAPSNVALQTSNSILDA